VSGAELPLAALLGYLIGALPSGVAVGRLRGVDPRAAGSGRTGTTNALRTLGPGLAAVVLLLDVAKGAAAVLIGGWAARSVGADDSWAAAIGGVAAVVGHVRSVFIRFGGGRGVATGAGAMLVLAPLTLPAALAVFGVLVWRTRYVSLGSIGAAVTVAVGAALLYALGRSSVEAVVAAALIGAVVVIAHADNIERLRAGSERRLGHG
jgi:acyl phosphate:glycerol-3-phosphate acyltransferase